MKGRATPEDYRQVEQQVLSHWRREGYTIAMRLEKTDPWEATSSRELRYTLSHEDEMAVLVGDGPCTRPPR